LQRNFIISTKFHCNFSKISVDASQLKTHKKSKKLFFV